tara:strand:- start:1007 stop:1294 length:288 start_codon:yes stop_codon:yes gene_type:complete
MKITKSKLIEIIREEVNTIQNNIGDFNEGHNEEGKMAKYDAKEIAQDSIDVFKIINKYDDLPEWLEAKITKAGDYMNSVKDYLTHHHSKMGGIKK